MTTHSIQRIVIPGRPPLPALLGVVHGDIRPAKQLGTGTFRRGAAGDANAGADINFAFAERHWRFQQLQRCPGERRRPVNRLFAAHRHSELIPAHPRQHGPRRYPRL